MEEAGLPFRHICDQNTDRSSRARSERRARSGSSAKRRVHRSNRRHCRSNRQHADQLAVVMIGAGEFFQLVSCSTSKKSFSAARRRGIVVGFDLAHGDRQRATHIARLERRFRRLVLCTNSLNAGPGAVAGAFVHERHATNTKIAASCRLVLANDPNTRFRLHLEPEFIPGSLGRWLANQ